MTRPIPDLVVIGAGVMGAWTALRAQESGLRTLLVDAFGIAHARASSSDQTRLTRASHADDLLFTRWSRRALASWLRLEQATGERLFVPSGVLWFARRNDGFEAASERTLTAEGIPVEHLSPAALEARWPQVSAAGLAFAMYEAEAGLLLARDAIAAVVRAFVAGGGRFEVASVRPVEADAGRLSSVRTSDGEEIRAGSWVFACGPWLPRLFPALLGDMIRVTKQDVAYFGPPPGDGRFGPEWLPGWVDYDAAFYGAPAIDGGGAKAASDRYGPVFDPTDGERVVDPDTVRRARRYLASRLPDLASQPVTETRVCQYEPTPDSNFLIDGHPDLANAWLVGGGSGHAFKHGPVIGETALALVVGEPAPPGHDRFRLAAPRTQKVALRAGGDSDVDWV